MEIKEKINKIEEMLEIDENTLTLDTELNSLDEWDSVAILSTIVMLDEEFGKKLLGEQIQKFHTVKDILDFMES